MSSYFIRKGQTVLILTSLIILSDCQHSAKQKRQNEINKIVFATGGCYGHCPIQVIETDSSLSVRYHGVKYTDKTGFYIGKVSSEFWDTLNIKFENVHYKQLDTFYMHSVDDLSTEIFIFYNNKVKHIYGQSASLPDSLMKVYNWLIKSIKQLNLSQSNDSLRFETIIEKPLPIPLLDDVKFIPPTKCNK